jgi:molybdate transport system substrate-binding protein
MNYLDERKLIAADTRRDVVGNNLVLIAPADSQVKLEIAPGFGLARALGRGRLATGDPDTVPVGKYARAALTKLGVWKDVESRIVPAENVRTALMYVARGEAPLGIVYSTDATLEQKVRVVDTFPADTHEPITYPAAATSNAQAVARAYLEYLGTEDAAAIWRKFGFVKPRQLVP